MVIKRIIATTVTTVFFIALPLMIFTVFLSLHTLVEIEIFSVFSFSIFLIFFIAIYLCLSVHIVSYCFTKEGIIQRNGWIGILIAVITFSSLKYCMNELVSNSNYFKLHIAKNPALPTHPGFYSFSSSDDRVCFSIIQRSGKTRNVLSRNCYERNEKNINYGT